MEGSVLKKRSTREGIDHSRLEAKSVDLFSLEPAEIRTMRLE